MSLPRVSLRQLHYFLAAAKSGQFSKAAAQMHVTQTAITTSIRDLEATLATSLFNRLPATGVRLTAAGQKFVLRAQAIVEATDDAVRTPLTESVSGTITVAASSSVLTYYLTQALARFRRAYPDVQVNITELDRQHLEGEVAAQRADFAFVWQDGLKHKRAVDTVSLIRCERQLWLQAQHPLLSKEKITMSDVAKEPYVMPTSDQAETLYRAFWAKAKLTPNVVVRTGSIEALRGLVAMGYGVTILSDLLYRPWSLEGWRVEMRPIYKGPPPVEIALAWRRGATQTLSIAAFRAFMVSTYRDMPATRKPA